MNTPDIIPTETTTTANVTLGLDLGDRQHSYCVLNAEGEILTEDQLVNTRECLEALSRRFPAATIAMETGMHSPWISRLFQARGHKVYVANARKVRAICSSVRPRVGTRPPHPSLRCGLRHLRAVALRHKARPRVTGRTPACSPASAASIRSCSARSSTAAKPASARWLN